jgi:hypothetical protein
MSDRRPEAVKEERKTRRDQPAMDDDGLRRGRPTCHRQFDEATAILAGDALQPMAFESIPSSRLDPTALGKLPSGCLGSRHAGRSAAKWTICWKKTDPKCNATSSRASKSPPKKGLTRFIAEKPGQ